MFVSSFLLWTTTNLKGHENKRTLRFSLSNAAFFFLFLSYFFFFVISFLLLAFGLCGNRISSSSTITEVTASLSFLQPTMKAQGNPFHHSRTATKQKKLWLASKANKNSCSPKSFWDGGDVGSSNHAWVFSFGVLLSSNSLASPQGFVHLVTPCELLLRKARYIFILNGNKNTSLLDSMFFLYSLCKKL